MLTLFRTNASILPTVRSAFGVGLGDQPLPFTLSAVFAGTHLAAHNDQFKVRMSTYLHFFIFFWLFKCQMYDCTHHPTISTPGPPLVQIKSTQLAGQHLTSHGWTIIAIEISVVWLQYPKSAIQISIALLQYPPFESSLAHLAQWDHSTLYSEGKVKLTVQDGSRFEAIFRIIYIHKCFTWRPSLEASDLTGEDE